MRLRSFLYPLGVLPVLALLSCSSEEPLPQGSVTEDPGEMWLSLNITGPDALEKTRAEGDTEDTPATDPYEKIVNSVIVYITKNGEKDILSVGFPVKDDDLSGSNGTYTALMPLSNKLTSDTDYDLHVAANLPDRDAILASVWTTGDDEVSGLTVDHSAITEWSCSAMRSGSTYIPMSSASPVTFKISNDNYSRENPISVTEPNGDKALSIELTRLFSRVDYMDISESDKDENTYPIDNNNQLMVTFTSIKPMNIATSSFLAFNKDENGQVNNPTGKSLKENANTVSLLETSTEEESTEETSTAEKEFIPLFYLAENTPTQENATFQNLTYVELTAKILPVEGKCPTEIKNVLEGKDTEGNATDVHPSLWYYDDGTFQSTLMAAKPDGAGIDHWIELTWDTTLGGYPIIYRHAIRHDAGKDASGNDLNKDDGIVNLMEYGIVRNTVYQVSIESVLSLPHPFADSPEDLKPDLKVQVTIPTSWDAYHRGAFEIEY